MAPLKIRIQFWFNPKIKALLLLVLLAFTFSVSAQVDCKLGALPSVQFASGSAKLSKSAMAILSAVSESVKQSPGCKIKVMGYGASDKRTQQLSWDQVNQVIKYFVEKLGISDNRLIFLYGQNGPATSVDLVATTEDGPKSVPAPSPTYQANRPGGIR